MKTNHITSALRRSSIKHNFTINRKSLVDTIASYTFQKESNVQGLPLIMEYDLDITKYDKSFVKPLIDMTLHFFEEQQKQMDEELKKTDQDFQN